MSDFVGTSHRDRIRGSGGYDYINVSQGGNDVVAGRQGDDIINFGATFTDRDKVSGGKGSDILSLNGDYSSGIEFTATNLRDFEYIGVSGGSYRITGVLVSGSESGFSFAVSAQQLEAGQTLDLDVTAPQGLSAYGGDGDDILRGSSDGATSDLLGRGGDDVLIGTGASRLIGGVGADRIVLSGSGDVAAYQLFENVPGPFDTIENFAASGGRIQLGFDSDTTTDGYQFDFHLGHTQARVGDIISHYNAAHDITVLRVFTDGDDAADFTVHVAGQVTFIPADFIFGFG